MFDKVKQLARSSLIYGLGNYGVKLVGFLLIPIYTRYLQPADYGVMALLSTFGQALFIFLNLGQSSALFRFYYDHDTQAGRDRVVAASLWIVILVSTPIALLVLVFARPIASRLLGDAGLTYFLAIAIVTVVFRQLLRLPFAVMRAQDGDTEYATWSIVRTALSAGLAILLVVGVEMGVLGVLLSSLLAEVLCCIILVPRILGALRTGWAGKEFLEQFYFGLIIIPGAIANFTLDVSDRFFLLHLTTLDEVGLYSVGYRFGEIIFFVAAAVQLAWPQFIFRNRRLPQAQELYSYATTYYLLGMTFLLLGLSMLAPEIIRAMTPPAYHRAAQVVPLIALAGFCEGLTFVGAIGITLHRLPVVRSAAMAVAAAIHVGCNFLLIPPYGMMGAAWATLIGFIVQGVIQVGVSLYYYPMSYQWGRLAKLTAVCLATYACGRFVGDTSLAVAIGTKAVLLLASPVLLWWLSFFEEAELEGVRRVSADLRKRLVPSRA